MSTTSLRLGVELEVEVGNEELCREDTWNYVFPLTSVLLSCLVRSLWPLALCLGLRRKNSQHGPRGATYSRCSL